MHAIGVSRRVSRSTLAQLIVLAWAGVMGCSETPNPQNITVGGTPTAGGQQASSGSANQGLGGNAGARGGASGAAAGAGAAATQQDSGGSATAGAKAGGGVSPAGGAPPTGGMASSGGVAPSGGVTSSGGSPSAGGIPSGGGPGPSGGTPSTGAASSTGGTASGGTSSTGGTGAAGDSAGGVETTYYLSDLCAVGSPINAWGPIERDLSNGEQAEGDGGPLTIDNVIFSKGLGTHAPSDIAFALGGNCSTFTAQIGVDDEMRSAGSVVFEVWGDGTRRYQSPLLTGASAATPVEVTVSGVQELRLVVSDNGGNGSDHADWGDAKLTCRVQPTTLCPKPATAVTVPTGYRLVWSDEFALEGPPDSANWSYETGFVRNEEAQWYQAANAWVQAGFLIIEGRRERLANPNYVAGSTDWKTNRQYAEYTSSSLHTRGHQSWQFGRFEMRGRIVAQAGLWPAWWTLGVAGEWPSNGEIDIMEYYSALLHANVACGTTTRWVAKWDSATRTVASLGVADWDAKFHLWTMDWNDTQIVLSVDGVELNTTNLSDMLNPDGQSPFRQPHYMLLNLAIGGTAGGDPSATAFPTRYEVDYVRVFQP